MWERWTESVQQDIQRAPDMATAVRQLRDRTRQWLRACSVPPSRQPNLCLRKDAVWQTGVAGMWAHSRRSRQLKGATVATVFDAWRHVAKFRGQRREFRRAAQARKRTLVLEFLADSSLAALQNDSGRWYQRIQKSISKACLGMRLMCLWS